MKIEFLLCPFYIIKREKSFLLWPLFVLIFSPLASFLPFVDGVNETTLDMFKKTYTNIFTLTLSLSLLIPMAVDLGLKLYVNYRRELKTNFVGRILVNIIISFIYVVLISIFFCKKQNDFEWLNLFITILSIAYTFYLYCIDKMEIDPHLLKYDTKTYPQEEKEKCEHLQKEADKRKETDFNGGKIKL